MPDGRQHLNGKLPPGTYQSKQDLLCVDTRLWSITQVGGGLVRGKAWNRPGRPHYAELSTTFPWWITVVVLLCGVIDVGIRGFGRLLQMIRGQLCGCGVDRCCGEPGPQGPPGPGGEPGPQGVQAWARAAGCPGRRRNQANQANQANQGRHCLSLCKWTR